MPFIISQTIDEEYSECSDEEHEPPTYVVLKPGVHIWQCPRCKEVEIVDVPIIRI